MMNRRTAFAALLMLMALLGCTPIGAALAPLPYAPHSPDSDEGVHGGGDGGGSGM